MIFLIDQIKDMDKSDTYEVFSSDISFFKNFFRLKKYV